MSWPRSLGCPSLNSPTLGGEDLIEEIATAEGPYEIGSITGNASNFATGYSVTGSVYLHSVDGYSISFSSHPLPSRLAVR